MQNNINSNDCIKEKISLSKKFQRIDISEEEYQKIISITKSHYIVDKENNFIGVVTKNKYSYEIRYIMTYCKVLRKIIDIGTKQIKIEYEYHNGIEIDTVKLDGESLSKFGLKTLFSYGVRFNETDIDEVNKYLMNTDMKAEIVYGYSKLGWDKIDNSLVFRYNNLIAKEPTKKKYIYNGNLCLNHKGSIDEWCNMIQNEVCGNIPMTYLLMASFSSPLLSMLNYTHDFGSVLFCLCNSSSKGKSTTAMLCASIYSSPVLNKGVAISFNGTENALQVFLSQINGLSVVFDELGASTISNLERVLYSFCLGRSKLRLNGDASLQDVKEFSSVIFTTSEISFISEKSMDGIKTRVFQIEDTLTKNAQNSDNIKNIVMQNYGVAGNEYLQMLVNKGQEIIEADYQKYKDMLIKNSKELDEKLQVKGSNILTDSTLAAYEQKKRLTDRILSKLAIVVQAAEYAKELFNFNIEISDMIDYSLNLTNAIESAQTPEDELLTIVHEDFVKNIRKYKINYPFALKIFGKRKAEAIDYNSINIGYVGLIRLSASDNYYEICVAKNYFEQLMKNNQISDFRKRLKNLRASGILVAEKDRLVAREKIIEIIDLKVYIFRFLFDDKMVSLHNACKETYFDKIENSDNIDFLSDDEVQNIEECLGGE
ncbi:DUF927 domain-containing protein [uncultured Ruminococcus sp.]|uniref:DUF927 domain-containing protein n=1 Tax=uncultured Ruminococcus sp. TaxID=165186 RepID=UPI0025DE56FE|nr:DUF927 domain-containing protein [uncultured Ruminococcus sp.]